jgi:hypothetical protein
MFQCLMYSMASLLMYYNLWPYCLVAILIRYIWVQWLLQHASGKIILHKCVLFNITRIDGELWSHFVVFFFSWMIVVSVITRI